ncbi:Pex19 protein [Cytidiella melzeri]|nr:Pex19 protein [Cytidiella melzeri]
MQFAPSQKPSGTASSHTAANSVAVDANKEKSAPANATRKPPASLEDLDVGEDFARELAEGMAALMREIAAEAGDKPEENITGTKTPASKDELEREANFRKAWENMLVDGMNGALDIDDFGVTGKGKAPAKPGEGSKAEVPEDSFQASIRKAMDKLKESDSSLQTDAASGGDPLDTLLSQLGEGGEETEEQIQGLLESMMAQLMSKEVLYEPLKELNEKFPAYMRDNAEKLSAEDKQRHESQSRIVTEVLAIYDDPKYDPDNQEQGVKVVTLMNTMQTLGSPPAEIMGPLPPGMELGKDGMPQLPDSCVIV